SKFIEIFKSDGGLACPLFIYCTAFVRKHLLHPKAGSGTVKQAEQGEMIVLGSTAGQLDDRSRSIEYLPSTVEHEVIVCGHEGKGDGEGGTKPMCQKSIPFPPCAT